MSKILILDIETSPNVAYVWRFFKENIAPSQVIKNSNILSFAAKWLHSEEILYRDTHIWSEQYLLEDLNKLLDEADIVVTHYGNKFDLPRIRARSLVFGISPPSPYKTVDTCMVAKRLFSFESNSLEYLVKQLGIGEKLTHKKFPGFALWIEVLRNNPEAWDEMKRYNIHDTVLTERLYLKLRPWINNHPNVAINEEDEGLVCPKCGGKHLGRRGFYTTNAGKYQRYRCDDCGGWSRTRFTELDKEKRRNLLTNAT